MRATHYAEAQHKIDSLVTDSIQRAEAEAIAQSVREEEEAYAACTTVAACEAYLSKYPQGRYLADVRKKLEELRPSNTGIVNGHGWVDLGLPSGTLWATCNIGASSPEGYGNYYAWGETSTKSTYYWDTYKYANGDHNRLTKYCNKSDYGDNGFTDNLTMLQGRDDPAAQLWGGGWQTPNKAQWDELLANTTNQWTTRNGVKGRLFTSKKNGQALFLPAAGYRDDSGLIYAGSDGYYWSSLLYTDKPDYAYALYLSSDNYTMAKSSWGWRSYGRSVRPVRSSR